MIEKSVDGVAHALSESMPPLEGEERRLALTLNPDSGITVPVARSSRKASSTSTPRA